MSLASVAEILRTIVPEKRTAIMPCVCGGYVRADRWEPMKGVTDHNRSRQHQEWRKAREA